MNERNERLEYAQNLKVGDIFTFGSCGEGSIFLALCDPLVGRINPTRYCDLIVLRNTDSRVWQIVAGKYDPVRIYE